MHPIAVFNAGSHDTVFRLGFGARILSGRIQEMRPAEFLRGFFLDRLIKKRQDLLIRIRHLRGTLFPILAELLIQSFYISDNERVFGTK